MLGLPRGRIGPRFSSVPSPRAFLSGKGCSRFAIAAEDGLEAIDKANGEPYVEEE
jgi:hypothetical protein